MMMCSHITFGLVQIASLSPISIVEYDGFCLDPNIQENGSATAATHTFPVPRRNVTLSTDNAQSLKFLHSESERAKRAQVLRENEDADGT